MNSLETRIKRLEAGFRGDSLALVVVDRRWRRAERRRALGAALAAEDDGHRVVLLEIVGGYRGD